MGLKESLSKDLKQNKNAYAAGLFSAATSFAQGMVSNRATARAVKTQAYSLRANARLALIQANMQNQYDNEQLANAVWGTYDQRDKMLGYKRAAIAASRFDVSAGDQRLTADDIRQTDSVVSGMNISAYWKAFENERAAMLEANRLEYAAKSADITAKYSSGWTGFAYSATQSTLSGLGAYFSNRYPNMGPGTTVNTLQ